MVDRSVASLSSENVTSEMKIDFISSASESGSSSKVSSFIFSLTCFVPETSILYSYVRGMETNFILIQNQCLLCSSLILARNRSIKNHLLISFNLFCALGKRTVWNWNWN